MSVFGVVALSVLVVATVSVLLVGGRLAVAGAHPLRQLLDLLSAVALLLVCQLAGVMPWWLWWVLWTALVIGLGVGLLRAVRSPAASASHRVSGAAEEPARVSDRTRLPGVRRMLTGPLSPPRLWRVVVSAMVVAALTALIVVGG
ncbi:hypothetical protein JSY14_11065 [Brachybacterium sp. EF45031]|uniref:hypothetical protein n=1 Tax=Brachybacterium sillae TaxID=2810536 RepID=UPI00217DBB39|nr:hypothetical protein [Brachybacterium sillae]MCS6712528.1 hypothetical protein [Brachybacterium sillae]